MNEYFTNTSNPQPNSSGSSSLIRAEFASIKAGFDKLPTIAGNGGEFVRINAGATALETTGDVVASLTVAATGKTTPVDADLVPLVDSEASNVLKKLTWANLKATLKTYFDSVTTTLTNKTLTSPVLSNPSYSGTTANGGTVTTIDINGGTIDGAAIGSTTPAAVSATTLSASGNISLTSAANADLTLTRAAYSNYSMISFNTVAGNSWGVGSRTSGVTPSDSFSIYSSTYGGNALSITNAGAVTIPGTLGVTGTTTVGNIVATYIASIADGANGGVLTFRSNTTNSGQRSWSILTDSGGYGRFAIKRETGYGTGVTTDALAIDNAGAVTIPGSVVVSGSSFSYTRASGSMFIDVTSGTNKSYFGWDSSISGGPATAIESDGAFAISTGGAYTTSRFRIETTGAVTIPGSVAISGGLTSTAGFITATTPGSGVSGLQINSTNADAANRNWVLVTNKDAFGDFHIAQSNAQNGDPFNAGTSHLKISNAGAVTVHSGTFGYGTGAGVTVTQTGSRTAGVTANKPSGSITLFTKSTTAGLVETFTVTNSFVAGTDTILLSMKSGSVSGSTVYIPIVSAVSAGSFNISIYTPAAIGSEGVIVNFAVIKGANA